MGKWYENDAARLEAKSAGVALIEQGYPHREAALAVGLPPTTLRRAHAKLQDGTAQDEDLRRADQAAMAQTYAIAFEAQSKTLEAIADGSLEPRDTIQAANVAMKALAAYRRWQRPEPDGADSSSSTRILDRLEAAMAAGAALTLTVTPPAPDRTAIDVVPIESETDR